MTTGKSARDDSLRELLKSPLDDRPQRSIRWWPWAIGAVVIALAGFTAMAIGGGEGAEPGAPSTTTAEHTLTTVPAYPDVVQYGELVSDPDSGLMLLIGGGTRRTGARIDGLSLDTYAFDPVEEIWGRLEVSGNLQGRVGHAIAFDSSRRSVLVFGGHTSADLFTCSNSGLCAASAEGDTWLLDLNESTWSEVRAAGPEGRYGAAMAYDPISGRVILFGGATPSAHLRTNGFLDDTWAFEPTVNRWAR
ncbi:hypothetical protein HQ535_11765, partial [bacterium]|nr:hypothetical protein [bacterium]